MKNFIPYLLTIILGIMTFALSFGFAILILACYAFVSFKFWYWFITPIFDWTPLLSFYQVFGLQLFTTILFKTNLYQVKVEQKKRPLKTVLFAFLSPFVLLITGYLLKTYFL